MGTGFEISYKAPPKNVFEYDVETKAGTFSVKNVGALDDCAASSEWKVEGTAANGKTVTYKSTPGCKILTPNFENIGKDSGSRTGSGS